MDQNRLLHIVERAYEGTIEEQDDQALWLVAAMKANGAGQQAVILRGAATSYAVQGHDASRFSVGGVKLGHPPRLEEDVAKLIAGGVPVYLVQEDARARGIEAGELIDGIKVIGRKDVADLLVEYSGLLAW